MPESKYEARTLINEVILLAAMVTLEAVRLILGQKHQRTGGRFNGIKKGTGKRTESKFATSICMNSEKEPGIHRFGTIFTKEISILIQ